jgi:prepilin-type N-terminal cleavage/methylation domain-containing protein
MRTSRRPRGFTLVELMIVVAIIGILVSVAFPGFHRVTIRSRTAERRTIMGALKQAADDFYIQKGRLVAADGTPLAAMEGALNPSDTLGPPSSTKRPFEPRMANWLELLPPQNTFIEGNLYYSYRFVLTDTASVRSLLVQARGDLDGDGIMSDTLAYYLREGGIFRLDPTVSTAFGSEDPVSF